MQEAWLVSPTSFPLVWRMDEVACVGAAAVPPPGQPHVLPFTSELEGIAVSIGYTDPMLVVSVPIRVGLEFLYWNGVAWSVLGNLRWENTKWRSYPGVGQYMVFQRAYKDRGDLLATSFPAGTMFAVRPDPDPALAGGTSYKVTAAAWYRELTADPEFGPCLSWMAETFDGTGDPSIPLDLTRLVPFDFGVVAVSWGAFTIGSGGTSRLTLEFKNPVGGVWTRLMDAEFPGGVTGKTNYTNSMVNPSGLPQGGQFLAGTRLRIRDTSESVVVMGASMDLWYGPYTPPPPVEYASWQTELRLAFNKEGIIPR